MSYSSFHTCKAGRRRRKKVEPKAVMGNIVVIGHDAVSKKQINHRIALTKGLKGEVKTYEGKK